MAVTLTTLYFYKTWAFICDLAFNQDPAIIWEPAFNRSFMVL